MADHQNQVTLTINYANGVTRTIETDIFSAQAALDIVRTWSERGADPNMVQMGLQSLLAPHFDIAPDHGMPPIHLLVSSNGVANILDMSFEPHPSNQVVIARAQIEEAMPAIEGLIAQMSIGASDDLAPLGVLLETLKKAVTPETGVDQ